MEQQAESPPINYLTDAYERIYDYEELYNSYLEARKNKRYRDDVLKYTDNLESNLIELQNELIWQTYKVGKYRPFFVYEPKKRLVMALNFKDRVAQWSVYRQLNPYYDRLFIGDSYACRKRKRLSRGGGPFAVLATADGKEAGKMVLLKVGYKQIFLPSRPFRTPQHSFKENKGREANGTAPHDNQFRGAGFRTAGRRSAGRLPGGRMAV